jgi:hypothetical protein
VGETRVVSFRPSLAHQVQPTGKQHSPLIPLLATHTSTRLTTHTASPSTGTWHASRCLAEPTVRGTSHSTGHAASPCLHAQEPSHGTHTSLVDIFKGYGNKMCAQGGTICAGVCMGRVSCMWVLLDDEKPSATVPRVERRPKGMLPVPPRSHGPSRCDQRSSMSLHTLVHSGCVRQWCRPR